MGIERGNRLRSWSVGPERAIFENISDNWRPIFGDYLGYLKHIQFLKMDQPLPLFIYFWSFQAYFYIKNVGVNGIQTKIVGVKCQHSDHLTTIAALHIHHCLVKTVTFV